MRTDELEHRNLGRIVAAYRFGCFELSKGEAWPTDAVILEEVESGWKKVRNPTGLVRSGGNRN